MFYLATMQVCTDSLPKLMPSSKVKQYAQVNAQQAFVILEQTSVKLSYFKDTTSSFGLIFTRPCKNLCDTGEEFLKL